MTTPLLCSRASTTRDRPTLASVAAEGTTSSLSLERLTASACRLSSASSGVHLPESALVLLELDVELVDRLRSSRSDGDEWRDRGQRGDVDGWGDDAVNLGGEEPDPPVHLVQSADVADKRSLERVHLGVQLRDDRARSDPRLTTTPPLCSRASTTRDRPTLASAAEEDTTSSLSQERSTASECRRLSASSGECSEGTCT